MSRPSGKLKVYTTSWCPDCKVAKTFLELHNVEYEEFNIDSDKEAEAFVMEVSGGRRVIPTFDSNGRIFLNPSMSVLARELNLT